MAGPQFGPCTVPRLPRVLPHTESHVQLVGKDLRSLRRLPGNPNNFPENLSPLPCPRLCALSRSRAPARLRPMASSADVAAPGEPSPTENPTPPHVGLRQLDQALHQLESIRGQDSLLARGPVVGSPSGQQRRGEAEAEAGRVALALARQLAAEGTLKWFGRAPLVPRRAYTADELRLHKIDPSRLLSPSDSTLGRVRNALQLAFLAALVATWQLLHVDQWHVFYSAVALLFLGTVDQVATGGAAESTVVDTAGHVFSEQYRERVAKHEAGHFLVSYLLGVLPSSYTLSSLDAVQKNGLLHWQQAGTALVDVEFQQELQSGKISAESLDKVTCIALAGVCSEYVLFGRAEGGLSDIQQLDSLFQSLRFSQRKSDEVVRWAVLNTVTILRAQREALGQLSKAMQRRCSVGECISTVEGYLEKEKS